MGSVMFSRNLSDSADLQWHSKGRFSPVDAIESASGDAAAVTWQDHWGLPTEAVPGQCQRAVGICSTLSCRSRQRAVIDTFFDEPKMYQMLFLCAQVTPDPTFFHKPTLLGYARHQRLWLEGNHPPKKPAGTSNLRLESGVPPSNGCPVPQSASLPEIMGFSWQPSLRYTIDGDQLMSSGTRSRAQVTILTMDPQHTAMEQADGRGMALYCC